MNTKSFSEVANVVTEILSRVLGDEDIPTPSMTNKGGNKLKIYYDDIF